MMKKFYSFAFAAVVAAFAFVGCKDVEPETLYPEVKVLSDLVDGTEFDASARTIEATVELVDVESGTISIEQENEWVTASAESFKSGDVITFTIIENEDDENGNSATITFAAKGAESVVYNISQTKCEPKAISVSYILGEIGDNVFDETTKTFSCSAAAFAGASFTISTPSGEWEYEVAGGDWLNPMYDEGESSLVVMFMGGNTTGVANTGTITITSEGCEPYVLTINQAAPLAVPMITGSYDWGMSNFEFENGATFNHTTEWDDYEISITPKNVTGALTFELCETGSNNAFAAGWATIDASGYSDDNQVVTVTLSAGSARSLDFVIKADGTEALRVTIAQ